MSEIIEDLEQWVKWVCEQKEKAPPEAISALPAVANIILSYLRNPSVRGCAPSPSTRNQLSPSVSGPLSGHWKVSHMIITIEAEPKEIAALVVALQERQGASLKITGKELTNQLLKALEEQLWVNHANTWWIHCRLQPLIDPGGRFHFRLDLWQTLRRDCPSPYPSPIGCIFQKRYRIHAESK